MGDTFKIRLKMLQSDGIKQRKASPLVHLCAQENM